MLIAIMAVLLAFNLLVIYWKLIHERIPDGLLDLTLLAVIATFFSQSTDTLMIGTGASALISIYLFFSPLKFDDTTTKTQKPSYEF